MRETHCQVDLISMLTLGAEWRSVHLHLERSLLRGTLVKTELAPGAWEFREVLVLTVIPLLASIPLCLRHRPVKGLPRYHTLDGLTNSVLSALAYHTLGFLMMVIS